MQIITTHRTIQRAMQFLMIVMFALSACQPGPGVPRGTAENSIRETEQGISTPVQESTDGGLEIIDDGSPLPPQLIQSQPLSGSEFPVNGLISLVFDQPMDVESTTASWGLTDPEGAEVVGDVSWPNPRTLQFTPKSKLKSGSVYRVTLRKEARSAQGIELQDPINFEFATVGDLEVSQVFPADETKDISSSTVITVIFNRPVVPLVIAEEQSDLPQPLKFNPQVSGKGEWVNTSVYAFRPNRPLKGDTTYTVTIEAGLEDAVGESHLPETFSWSFTTASPEIESFELSTGQVNPQNGLENVLPDVAFKINFLQPMSKTSVQSALSLLPASGPAVELDYTWNIDSDTIVFTPTQRLDLDTTYSLILDSEAQAEDGGALREGINWQFKTIPLPAVLLSRPENNSVQESFEGGFFIKFASPMRIDTVKDRIVVSPRPDQEINWWYNEWDWSISGYFLQPSTRYEILLRAGMEDIYGNAIQTDTILRFTTGERRPFASLAMPYDVPVFRAFGPPDSQQFYATYTNIDQVSFTLAGLSANQMVGFLGGNSYSYRYRPDASTVLWESIETSTGKINENVVKSFQFSNGDEGPLPPGFYFLGMDSPQISHENVFLDYRLFIVASANLTFKSSTRDALVWLTDMESGRPIPGVKVRILDRNFKEIGSGQTGTDGSLYLELPEPSDPYEPRFALAEDGKVFGFSSSQWGSGISLYDFGIWSSYFSPADQPTAYIYTERPLYRPGQPVYFKGIVRMDYDLEYKLPEADQVHVKISSFKDTVFEQDLQLSSFGSFDGKLILDPEAALGNYTIEASFPGTDLVIGTLNFNVAEYRKPEYQVKLTSTSQDVLDGDAFRIDLQAEYFSGGGVSDASVNWTLTSELFNFTPPDEFNGYNFRDFDEDVRRFEEETGNDSQLIAEGSGRTDTSGRYSETITADLSDSKTSRQLTFEATVTDVAESPVSGRTTVVAHQSSIYPGIKPRAYIGKVGEEQTFDLVALDWDGQPLANQKVAVQIVERRWYSVQEQDPSGRITWKSTVEEIPVTEFDEVQTDSGGKASVSFTPETGGIFKAIVSAIDLRGKTGRASASLWVAGEDYIAWQQTNDRGFDLVTDQKKYTPGDVAQVLIASPFEGETYALVTVERGRIRYQEVIKLTSNSTIYELPITPEFAPNVYISVLVMKGVDENYPRPDFKMGMREIQIDTRQQSLQVSLLPDRTIVGPGEQVGFTVRTRNAEGLPVSAEVSLGLSDLATLSLFPPNSSPILDHFFSERSLSVWTAVPLSLSIDDYNADIKENLPSGDFQGSGGGKGEGDIGVVEVRQDFPDTAFWDARVVTGANGEANVTITLPDNLTTWRMDARAVTLDTRVGQSITDIVSTKPLLVRPQTPRFFVSGDQVRIGTAVNNNTDEDLTVNVSIQADGLTLQSPLNQTIEIPARRQGYIAWDATVNPQAQRVDLVFSASGNGYKDASRPPQGTLEDQGLPVYRYEARETIGTSGQMTGEGTRIESILLPENLDVSSGALNIKVQPSLAAGMTDGLAYLEHFPYECIEQTVSRFLPNVISTRALKSAGIQDQELEESLGEQVNTALQRLYNWQNPDGGWGWWNNEKSDALTSAYVLLGFIEGEEAGYGVDKAAIERAVNYLRTQIVPLTGLKDPAHINRQAFLLYVLARAGSPDVSSTVQLYDQRQRMALYARAFLTQALHTIDSDDQRLATLLTDFAEKAILSATGSHWEEDTVDRLNWNTDTRTTAIILSTLSHLEPNSPLNVNAVRWLMSSRTNGHWKGTQETAWTIMALTNWMVASGELAANYRYAIALNGERLGGGSANSENLRQSTELRVDISKLIKDKANRLAFARDEGPGNLYYTAHLDVMLPVDQIEPLERGVIVSRSYYTLEDPDKPIKEAKLGDLLLARVTVVAPKALHYLVIDDPLPAGLEAVDQSLSTSPQSVEVPKEYSWNDVFWRGWGWWYFSNIQRRDEKVVISASYLPAGTYIYTYLVRAGTVGIFNVIPTTAQEFYFPEVYGRAAGSLFTVTP